MAAHHPCWGPGQGPSEMGVRGTGSPRVPRKVLGPLGQELCGPLQLLQAGAGCDCLLKLLLLTGGPRVCTGWGG